MTAGTLSQIVETVNYVTEGVVHWTTAIVSLNYEIVSSVITTLFILWSAIVVTLTTLHGICSAVATFLFDLVTECFNIVCMLIWMVQSVCRIIIRVLSLAEHLFYPFEFVVLYSYAAIRWMMLGLWTCLVSVFTGLFTSLGVTYGGLKMGCAYLVETFDKLGSSTIWVVNSVIQTVTEAVYYTNNAISNGVSTLVVNLQHGVTRGADELLGFFTNTYASVNKSFTFEMYCGMIVLVFLYMFTLWLRNFVSEHGLTFPAVFQFNDNADNVPDDIPRDNSDTDSVASENSDVDEIGNDFDDVDEVPLQTGQGLRKRPPTPARDASTSRSSKDLEHELECERDKRLCVICQDQVKNVLILPCKHLCACVDCANQLLNDIHINRRVCPLCRCKIRQVIDVYT